MCVFFFVVFAPVAVEGTGRDREKVLLGTSRTGQATLLTRVCGMLRASFVVMILKIIHTHESTFFLLSLYAQDTR